MRALIPFGGLAALIWLVNLPMWRHASHDTQIRLAVGILVPFVLAEMVLSLRAARKKSRKPASPAFTYAAPARRR